MAVRTAGRDLRERSDAPVRGAVRVGLLYVGSVALVAAWVLYSDPLVASWIRGPAGDPWLNLSMGAAFVLATGGVVAGLTYLELKARGERTGQLLSLIDQGLAGISVVQDGAFRFVNARFAEIFGYDPEELVGTPVIDLIAPEERELVAENLRRRIESEIDDIRYRYTGQTKRGNAIRVDVHGRRVEWDGHPAVMSVHLDVTEEDRRREQARRSQRLEALGELTGSVAHDFNNLLTTIVAPLDLCEDEIGPDHPIWPEIQEAKAGAKRAVTLTRQLLEFSRRRIYRPRPIDMRELVQAAAPMLNRLTPAGVSIDLDLADDAPTVEVDPALFEQVLLNLVTNAADAIGPRGRIGIRVSGGPVPGDAPSALVLQVTDDGKGMDEETMSRIFEPFFTTRPSGTGLGLSTTHGIVTQAGGTVTVDSTLGKGTTFSIRLPGTNQAPEALRPQAPSTGNGEARPTRSRSVLVVDDEDPVRAVAARVLTRHGMKVQMAATGTEALAMLDQGPAPDILLTDVGLPDMNGVELAARIREMSPGVAVLYMSGHSDEAVLRKMARERSSGFVEKPFTVETLMDAISSTGGHDEATSSERRGA